MGRTKNTQHTETHEASERSDKAHLSSLVAAAVAGAARASGDNAAPPLLPLFGGEGFSTDERLLSICRASTGICFTFFVSYHSAV